MDMKNLFTARLWLGRLFIVAAVLALSGVFDGLISSVRKPETELDILPGTSQEIMGKLYGDAVKASDLQVISDAPDLDVRLDAELFKGFWLGEDMWRGKLVSLSSLRPGTYWISVMSRDLSRVKPDFIDKVKTMSTYTVTVHEDAAALRNHQASFFVRGIGISPWWVAVTALPLVLLSGMAIFLVSGEIDKAMAHDGKAEVYRVKNDGSELEVFFGLGKSHGLEQGDRVRLSDEAGRFVTELCVATLGMENSSAVVDPGIKGRIRPGYRVARI